MQVLPIKGRKQADRELEDEQILENERPTQADLGLRSPWPTYKTRGPAFRII